MCLKRWKDKNERIFEYLKKIYKWHEINIKYFVIGGYIIKFYLGNQNGKHL